MTPRRKEFRKECEYFQRVLIRRLSRISLKLLKLEHYEQELIRQIGDIEQRINEENEKAARKMPVRLSDVYKMALAADLDAQQQEVNHAINSKQ